MTEKTKIEKLEAALASRIYDDFIGGTDIRAVVVDENIFYIIQKAARAHLQTLKSGVDRPDICEGRMHCAKCKFQLVRTNIHFPTGNFSAGDNKTEPCPNGCGPLWPVTWKMVAMELDERLGQELAAKPTPPVDGDKIDAEKWRALVASRMYCMGAAGFGGNGGQFDEPDKNGYRHMTLNLWTFGPSDKTPHDLGYGWDQDVTGLKFLNDFIDQAVKNPSDRRALLGNSASGERDEP